MMRLVALKGLYLITMSVAHRKETSCLVALQRPYLLKVGVPHLCK